MRQHEPSHVQVPESFPVTVRLPDGTTVDVDGRVGKMIEWLLLERVSIETLTAGGVTFNVGPTSFQPELRIVHARVAAAPEGK